VARTVHRGPYSGLAKTHRALLDWCASNGLRPTQTRWEIYGPHCDDPDEIRVEVSWLVGTAGR
jgi:effector-binding domain-containing protein